MWLLLLAGCPLPKEDDSAGESGGAPGTDTTEDTTSVVDSCMWDDMLICFEFEAYPDTEEWCDRVPAEYGAAATYDTLPCPTGAVVACSLPAASGTDFDHDAEAYYYAPNWDVSGANSACASAGGSPHAP